MAFLDSEGAFAAELRSPNKADISDCGPKISKDEIVLARFGKKQQLRRGFRSLSAIGLVCSVMLSWEVVTMTLQYGLINGGPAGLIYGFLFAWFGQFLQALVMAEMASMIPLAGGPFNWVAVLSPPWCRKFLSYLSGWLTVAAWQIVVANVCYVSGILVQGLLVFNYPDYVFERWHGTLFFYAVIATSLFFNTWLARLLPQIESLMLIIHILGFFGVLIPLVYLSPHKTAKEVFSTFQNLGGWQTDGLSFFVGLITAMGSIIGVDSADHIAEEIENAQTVIPISMMISIALNGATGFAMLIALLFCMGDIEKAATSNTGFPFIDIFLYGLGSVKGATAMAAFVTFAEMFSSIGILATSSRMLWAFAREKGLPGSGYIARIDRRTKLPLWAIAVTVLVNLLLALINIGSTAAFQAFVSVGVAAYYSSFLLAAGVMFHKRMTTPRSEIPRGPFTLGRWGLPLTIAAILYTIVGLFFSFWPVSRQVDAVTMNYAVLILGGVIIFSIGFWFVHGRRIYTGPIMEFEGGVLVL